MNQRFTLTINNKEYIGLLTFNQDNKNYLVYTDNLNNENVNIYAGIFDNSIGNTLDLKPVNDQDLNIVKNKIKDLALFLG